MKLEIDGDEEMTDLLGGAINQWAKELQTTLPATAGKAESEVKEEKE